MSCHPLVTQLRFARANFVRCLEPVSAAEAHKRIDSMNCMSWTIGHLANQEHRYWVEAAQGKTMFPDLNDRVGYGKPASTPPLAEMWEIWHMVTTQADVYLESVTTEELERYFQYEGRDYPESVGTLMLRNIYHYWVHTGEARTMRELLGHGDLPEYVGDMSQAAYRRENAVRTD